MKKITEQVKPVIAREPGKKNGAIGGVLIGPDGKPIKGSWRKISDLPTGQRPPQANIDNFLRIEKEKANQGTRRPPVPGLPPSASEPGSGPKGNKVGSTTPTPLPKGDDRGGRTAPPARQSALQASPVAAYMRAAAAARKSGDPAQMAAVRDQGLEIWRKKYADTLAKKVSPTGQQLGTGQSVMAKQAAELRALRPTPEAPVNTSAMTTTAPAPQPPVKTDTAAQRVQAAQKPIPSTVKPIDTSKMSNKKGTSTGTLAASYEYDAYDLVLEYLISNGHADTLEEANYVMMQLDSDYIGSIVEGTRPTPVEQPLDKASFKKRRRSLAGREASADAKSRGHVDKFTGKPYGTAEAASRRKNLNPAEREARRKFAEDPD